MTDYLPSGKTITGPHYAQLMFQVTGYVILSDRNVEENCHLGVWFLHDNAPVHKSVVAQQAVRDCEFVQLNHPECCQDLGPSDYFLLRNMKFYLRGTWFIDAE